jgi:hypothetical protein
MRHHRIVTLTLALALALALFVSLSACGDETDNKTGGNGSAAGTTTFRNEQYGFSMTYPADYVKAEADSSSEAGASEGYGVAFADPDGEVLGDSTVDGVQVVVYELDRKLSAKEVRKLRPVFKDLVDEMVAGLENGEIKDKLGPVELNGAPGFGFSYYFTKEGKKVRASTFFLVKGKHEYMINAQAAVDRWDEVAGELEAAAMSFRID